MEKFLLAHKIDLNGYMVFEELKVLSEGAEVPEGYITEPLPTDEQGYQLPFFKAKWTGDKWIEGASQEEINELTKFESSPPSQEERIKMLEDTINFLLEL